MAYGFNDDRSKVDVYTKDEIDQSLGDYVKFTNTMTASKAGVAKVGSGLEVSNGALQLNSGNIGDAVDDWLDDHPEATTTVQDGAVADVKLVQSGGVLSNVSDSRLLLASIVKHSENIQSANTYSSKVFKWIIGSISGGIDVDAVVNRCRVFGFIPGWLFESVQAKAGFSLWYFVYTNDSVDSIIRQAVDWVTSFTNPDPNKYYRFAVKKTDDSDFNEPENDALLFTLGKNEVLSEVLSKLSNLTNLFDLLSSIVRHSDGSDSTYDSNVFPWEIGSISAGVDIDNPSRCRVYGYIPGWLFDSVEAKTGYQLWDWHYDDESGTNPITDYNAWITEYTNTKKTKFYRFAIKKDDGSNFSETVSDALVFTINAKTFTKDLLSNPTIIANSYYTPNGSTNDFNGWSRTSLIALDDVKTIILSGINTTGNTPSHVFYDSNNSFISSVKISAGTSIIPVPKGAAYVGFSVKSEDASSLSATGSIFITDLVNAAVITDGTFNNLPDVSDFDLCRIGIAPWESDGYWHNDCGLMWSDGHVWRKTADNSLAITAQAYRTIRLSDSKSINNYHETDTFNIASITKLLTAIVVETNATSLSNTFTLQAGDYIGWDEVNYIKVGDTLDYLSAMNSMIIQSDNNAAQGLARAVGYEIDPTAANDNAARAAFYAKMQQVAAQIGMQTATSFTAAYTGVMASVTDVCKLVKYVYENTTVTKSIWNTLSYELTVTGDDPRTWTIYNSVPASDRLVIPEYQGGKTGTAEYRANLAFVWLNPYDEEMYATTVLRTSIKLNTRIKESRVVLNEVYELLEQDE